MSYGVPGIPRGIKTLVIATLVVYFFQILPGAGAFITSWGALVPYLTFIQGQIWRAVTYMFLHGSPFHILFNMLMLWMFGVEIENMWGTRRFVAFYLICGAGSAMFSILNLFNSELSLIPVIGASGAVLGVLTIYAYYFPHRQVLLFFILPVNIRIIVVGYALYSLFGTIAPRGVISHLTHLGGIVVALLYLKLYPLISDWYRQFRVDASERQMRKEAERRAERARYFEQKVDPILEKISKEGMEALTAAEKKILKEASKIDKTQLKKNKIIPFDPFR